MKWQQIKSDKHVGATFFKVEGTKKNFVCKVYAGHETERRLIENANNMLETLEKIREYLRINNAGCKAWDMANKAIFRVTGEL